ncbi:uncharacterized protein KY384_007556 [Bacidia gigantensis]|uniref:uncharacterized protein n=1 Tax=Bacidia gigantensis TaxID=2732470 RepID=UPI001D03D4AD|nr:uncharacterized protein KY384_007556 [Bacidia gigantensis]KAG8527404.1 hypothetical protein KY384_007556 [Bacidia gigantensis]
MPAQREPQQRSASTAVPQVMSMPFTAFLENEATRICEEVASGSVSIPAAHLSSFHELELFDQIKQHPSIRGRYHIIWSSITMVTKHDLRILEPTTGEIRAALRDGEEPAFELFVGQHHRTRSQSHTSPPNHTHVASQTSTRAVNGSVESIGSDAEPSRSLYEELIAEQVDWPSRAQSQDPGPGPLLRPPLASRRNTSRRPPTPHAAANRVWAMPISHPRTPIPAPVQSDWDTVEHSSVSWTLQFTPNGFVETWGVNPPRIIRTPRVAESSTIVYHAYPSSRGRDLDPRSTVVMQGPGGSWYWSGDEDEYSGWD